MQKIGIDIGSSLIKIVYCKDGKIIYKHLVESKNANEEFEAFLNINNIDLNSIDKVCLTGIRANEFSKKYDANYEVFDEFVCCGKGALELTKKEKAIIVNIRYRNFIY